MTGLNQTSMLRVAPSARWPILIALAGLAAAAPLWVSQLLPFQDVPQHIAAIRILADWGASTNHFRHWFELDFARSQYLGVYLPGALLARFIGPSAACRVLLSLIALSFPAACWMLLGSFNRDRRLAIFAPLIFHSSVSYIGLFGFVASVPATAVIVALIERELQAPRRSRALLIAAGTICILYLHVTGVALAAGAALVLGATSRLPWRRVARALIPLAPALLLLGVWAIRAPPPEPTDAATHASGPYWQPFLQQLLDVGRLGNVLVGRLDEIFIGALLAVFLAIALFPFSPAAPREFVSASFGDRLRARRLPILAAALFAAYLVSPVGVGHVWLIHLRFLPLLALVAIAVPVTARRRATSVLLGAALVLELGYACVLVNRYRAFDLEAQPAELKQVLEAAKPGGRLIGIIMNQESQIFHFKPYMHFALYYEVLRGGRSRFNFGELPWMPLRFRHDVGATPFPPNWEWDPGELSWERIAHDADYVLVRGDVPPPASRFTLKRRAGIWSLYEPAPALPR